jgi:DNA-binding transcriptional MocR family regulator
MHDTTWTKPATAIPWESLLAHRLGAGSLQRANRLTPAPSVQDAIDLASQQPSPDLVPHEEIRSCLDAVLRERRGASLGYAQGAGVPELRTAIAEDLSAHGVAARPEDVVVTSGSQQALDLLSRALVDPEDPFLVEDATYPGTLHLLETAGARIVSVPWDAKGPDLGALERAARPRPKGLYLMPNFHNPLGTSIDERRREEIVAWSHRHGVPIVEDDYDSDLDLDGAPSRRRLRTIDADVCHVGTYSKKLIPALRIGYLVCPEPLRSKVVALKLDQDNGSSALLQHALAEFLRRGLLAAHLARSLREYRARRDAFEAALAAHLPAGMRWTHPERGLFLWVPLPTRVSSLAVFEEARQRGVLVLPSLLFAAGADDAPGIRLTFCRETPARLEEGARRFAAAVRAVCGDLP